jgi:uncharacterized membrane protein YdbT with pleckstrin-like domain
MVLKPPCGKDICFTYFTTRRSPSDTPRSLFRLLFATLRDGYGIKLAGIAIPKEVNNQLRDAIKRAINEAYINGFHSVMLICAVLALTSAAIAWLMIKDSSKPADE